MLANILGFQVFKFSSVGNYPDYVVDMDPYGIDIKDMVNYTG